MIRFILLFAVLLLIPLLSGFSPERVNRASPPGPSFQQCTRGQSPEGLTLEQLWQTARDREPGYRAVAELREAEEDARDAARREWLPGFSVDGLGTHGQRLSPGEERVLGVGPRGEFRLTASWSLVESDRGARARVSAVRERAAAAGERAFDVRHRGLLAALYAEGAAAEERWSLLHRHSEALREMAELLEGRLEAGVDARWEGHLLREAQARAERLLLEAETERAGIRGELSAMTGRCVRPLPLSPPSPEDVEPPPQDSPEMELLRRQAETREALARQEGERGRWSLQLLGITGPNYSRAFGDDRVRNEYLLGVSAAWRPDLAGVRSRLASAEQARARAVRAEAESLALALERELARIRTILQAWERRRAGLARELQEAEQREEAALLRWRVGVDRWTEVLQARDRVLEVRTLELELRRELALVLIVQARATGRVEALPALLGQEEDR
jgi:outer membrane protein TolC